MKRHTERIQGAHYATECYFERAIRFQPNDPMVRLVYAIYLRDRKRTAELRTQLDEAERARGDQSNYDLDYNLGLMYFEIGDLDKATVAAKRAYALGAPLPALASKLKAKGRSVQAPPAAAAAATAPTSTPASPTAAATAPEVSPVPSAPPAVSAAPTAAPPTAQ
jgi:tetratricopeptide (TPR) repeat protein